MLVSEFTGPGTAAGRHKACGDGYLALYLRAPALFRDLALARADGDLRSVAGAAILADLPKGAAFVLGQSSHRPVIHHQHVNAAQRYQARSFVLVSQLPVARWQD